MDIQATKLDVMQKIMSVSNESLLEKIDKLLEKELIVGYTAKGEPLTRDDYNSRMDQAEKQIAIGNYLSQEEIETETENWPAAKVS